jgi:hypothetical protein
MAPATVVAPMMKRVPDHVNSGSVVMNRIHARSPIPQTSPPRAPRAIDLPLPEVDGI